MCLGTTRNDAGSAANFIRCDYDYVIAFMEAVLTFSGPAGFVFPSDVVNNNNERSGNNAQEEIDSSSNKNDKYMSAKPKHEDVSQWNDDYVYHIGDGTRGANDLQQNESTKFAGTNNRSKLS